MTVTTVLITRDRPELLAMTVARTLPNIQRQDTRLLICVDDDDQPTIASLSRLPEDRRIILSVRPREDSRGEKYDRALTEAPADIYFAIVDYAPVLTKGFDQLLIDKAAMFPDGIGCIYTPMVNASFPGYQAITAKMVEKIGYIYNHDYPFWFVDHELDDIARMCGRFVFADIDVDYSARPNRTIRMRDVAFWAHYFDASILDRRQKAHAILDSSNWPDQAMKEIIRGSYPVVEFRSVWINQCVRMQAAEVEGERGEPIADPAYLRSKARAEKKMIGLMADLDREISKAA